MGNSLITMDWGEPKNDTNPEEEFGKCVSIACPQSQKPDDKLGNIVVTQSKGLISLTYIKL